jgi:hypothetical protein
VGARRLFDLCIELGDGLHAWTGCTGDEPAWFKEARDAAPAISVSEKSAARLAKFQAEREKRAS